MQQAKRPSIARGSVASSRASVDQKFGHSHNQSTLKDESSPIGKKKRQVSQSGLKQFDAVIAMVEQTRIRPPTNSSAHQSGLLQPIDLYNTETEDFLGQKDEPKQHGNVQLLKKLLRDQVLQRQGMKKMQRENERLSDLVDRLSAQNAQLFASQKRLDDIVEQKLTERLDSIEAGLDHRFQMVKAHLSRLAARIQAVQDADKSQDVNLLLQENKDSKELLLKLQDTVSRAMANAQDGTKRLDDVQQQSRRFQELFEAQERQIVETQYMVARVQDSMRQSQSFAQNVSMSQPLDQSSQSLKEYKPLDQSDLSAKQTPKNEKGSARGNKKTTSPNANGAQQQQTAERDADGKVQRLQEQIQTLLDRISQIEMVQVASKPMELPDSKLLLLQSQLQLFHQRQDGFDARIQQVETGVANAVEVAQKALESSAETTQKLESTKLQDAYLQERLTTKFDYAKLEQMSKDMDEKNDQLDKLLQELTCGFSDVSKEVKTLKQQFKSAQIEAEATEQIQKKHGKDIEAIKQAVTKVSQAYDAFTSDTTRQEENVRFIELQIKDRFIKAEQLLKQQHENELLPLLDIINEKIKAINKKTDAQQQNLDTREQIQQALYQQFLQLTKTFQTFSLQIESEQKKQTETITRSDADLKALQQSVGDQFKAMGDVIENVALTMERLEHDQQKAQAAKQLENTIMIAQTPEKQIQELQDIIAKQKNDTSELVGQAVQIFLEGYEDLRRRVGELQTKTQNELVQQKDESVEKKQ